MLPLKDLWRRRKTALCCLFPRHVCLDLSPLGPSQREDSQGRTVITILTWGLLCPAGVSPHAVL